MKVKKIETMFGRQPSTMFEPDGVEIPSFYISYNPDTTTMGAFLGGNGPETALVDASTYPKKFYILNGDWRESYRPLVDKGFDACFSFFVANVKHKSDWSN